VQARASKACLDVALCKRSNKGYIKGSKEVFLCTVSYWITDCGIYRHTEALAVPSPAARLPTTALSLGYITCNNNYYAPSHTADQYVPRRCVYCGLSALHATWLCTVGNGTYCSSVRNGERRRGVSGGYVSAAATKRLTSFSVRSDGLCSPYS